MRTARKQSASGFYHVMVRGVGQQIIFESDADRNRYISSLSRLLEEEGGELIAWCLMDNHMHALMNVDIQTLAGVMRRTNSGYALYFNTVHERNGHLFQGRFKSEPVDTDEYFMTVLRYIHQNPQRAGLSAGCAYEWSSYNEYVAGTLNPKSIDVIALFGGIDQFVRFHQEGDTNEPALTNKIKVGERRALEVAEEELGMNRECVKSLPRAERDAAIVRLKRAGLTARQIQRLTGISLGVIGRAK